MEDIVNEVLFGAPKEKIDWGRPFSYSVSAHALLLALIPFMWKMQQYQQIPLPHILEIKVSGYASGQKDLALRGTQGDWNRGPTNDTRPARSSKGNGAHHHRATKNSGHATGLVATNSAASAASKSAQSAHAAGFMASNFAASANSGSSQAPRPAPPLPKPLARGALFKSASGATGASALGSGVGREKIYADDRDIATEASAAAASSGNSAGSSSSNSGAAAGAAAASASSAHQLAPGGALFGYSGNQGASAAGADAIYLRTGQGQSGASGSSGVASDNEDDDADESGGAGGSSGNGGNGYSVAGGLGGGNGSVNGGAHLEGQGKAIIGDYPLDSDGIGEPSQAPMNVPQSNDDFFSLTGALKGRLQKMDKIKYPRWAEEQGVETHVSVHLEVDPQGHLDLDNTYVTVTSGYPEIDKLVLENIKHMVFAASSDDNMGNDAGVATFNFKLKKEQRG